MDKNLMDALYVRYNDKFGVLSDNEREIISHILGTDLTLVLNKENMEVYLLVPLTRNHKFEYKPITLSWMARGLILTSISASMVANGLRCNQKKCYQW